jgi:hypothetical protein
MLQQRVKRQDKFRREPMIFFRSSDNLGQAITRRAQMGSRRKLCVPICVPASASCSGCNVPTSVRASPELS